MKYASSDLMWTFDGPIHLCNKKFDDISIALETYDDSLKGAAAQVTRDGLNPVVLGNYRYALISGLVRDQHC